MINNKKIAELKIVARAAQERADVSGTFRAIGLKNTARALREVANDETTSLQKVANLVREAGKTASGRADTAGRYEGLVLAQKIIARRG